MSSFLHVLAQVVLLAEHLEKWEKDDNTELILIKVWYVIFEILTTELFDIIRKYWIRKDCILRLIGIVHGLALSGHAKFSAVLC